MTSSNDSFSSTVTATNNNLSRLSKTVASTASTLISSSYGDLSNTHYQSAMTDIARRPAFQRRLFSFSSRRTPSEVVKSSFSKREIQYQAVTTIPDELLRDIPADSNPFSLFQGFQASKEDIVASIRARSSTKALPNTEHTDPKSHQEFINHRLDLLEIRKQLASTEIKEIDQRIDRLQSMREIVFERVAQLEQEELSLESELQQLDARLNDDDDLEALRTDDLPIEAGENGSVLTPERAASALPSTTSSDYEEGGLMTESVYGKLQEAKPHKVRRHSASRRKTMPTLQQFYSPGKNIRTIEAHSERITALDFDIPFGTMVSSSVDDTVTVWDLSKGTALTELTGHNASVKCLQMDNNLVATGSADATIKLWDLANDTDPYLETFEAHLGEITALHFSDSTLVTGSDDKTIRQWDLHTGRCLQTLDVLWAAAQSTGFANLDSAKWRRQSTLIQGAGDSAFVGALQCFDAALATGTADGIVRLWDLRTGQVHRSLVGHTGPVTCLQFDDVHLATGSTDRSIRIWDLRTGSIFDAFAYDSPISSLHFDPRRIVSANHESTVKIYDREVEKHWTCGAGEQQADAAIVNTVRYREGYLVEGRDDGRIGVWAC